jgi:hypothetical protein
MLSSDKNIETIAQLIEVLKHYLGLQTEYVKLDVIDKVVRLLTATALAILFFLIIIAVLLFLSLGIAFWLANYMSLTCAFLIISAVHVVFLLLFIVFRKSWIERPIVRFLASLFMS